MYNYLKSGVLSDKLFKMFSQLDMIPYVAL